MFEEFMKHINQQCAGHFLSENTTETELDKNIFQLPIAFLEQKNILEEHTVNDLELLPTVSNDSLYTYVLNPDTLMGKNNVNLWSKYYTANTTFLKESQKLLKNKLAIGGIPNETQLKINTIWDEIRSETGFHEKYGYIEWERLQLLNHSSKFLQCLSIYNMASPVFSLMLPIVFLIIPLLIIKMRGIPITIEKYIELLKMVFKKHQLGQLFDLSNASMEKIVYVLASAVFYIIQIYQNIMSCRKFYQNITKIHEQLFVMKDYLQDTLQNMDIIQKQCERLDTYAPFIADMNQYRGTYQCMLDQIKQVTPYKLLSIHKISQIGHIMRCFYKLYKNNTFLIALKYSFGFNGYIDNLNGIRENSRVKNISTCKFAKPKSNTKTKSNAKTKFTDAYFPTLVHENPVKNTYSLDKHLLITGPNAAGKTTLLKTTIFNIILSQQIGFGFYKKATIVPYDMIHCYINIPDTSARDSLFQAEAKRCKDILEKIDGDTIQSKRHFCVFDELYSGTNPYEAVSSAYAFLKYLHKNDNINFVLTTHFLELCRRLNEEKRMHNCHMKIDVCGDDFKYTYKMEKGISTIKGGIKVLKDLEYPEEIINTTMDTLKDLDI